MEGTVNDNLIETLSLAPVFTGCDKSALEELVESAGHRLRHKEEGERICTSSCSC